MKKYLFTMVVMAIFAIGFAASDESNSSKNEQQKEKEEPKVNMALVGTYEATIYGNNAPFHIILKKDGTAESYYPRNHQQTFYGHWEEDSGGIKIEYKNQNNRPDVRFPFGMSWDKRFMFSGSFYIHGGYLYPDINTFWDRDEGWRIPIKKIN